MEEEERAGQGRAGECSARLQVAGCMLLAASCQLPPAVEVNYSPVILLIATICSLELLQIDDNVSGESKQMMSPTEKIVCWPCCICQLDFVGYPSMEPSWAFYIVVERRGKR